MRKDTKIIDDYYSECCLEPVYIYFKKKAGGLFCSGCNKITTVKINPKTKN